MSSSAATADFLEALRYSGATADRLPPEHVPTDEAGAYDAQALLVQRVLAHLGGKRIGYKIACTSEHAQRLLGTDGPAAGVLFSATTHASPAALTAASFSACIIEPEFAFRMARDVPAGHHDAASIAGFVAALLPAIEIVDHRFAGLDQVDALTLVADNAIHGGFVHGADVASFDAAGLADAAVSMRVNGELHGEGRGGAALGSPLNALAWLANHLASRGEALRANDIVTTGTCMDVYVAHAGDDIVADFGGYGTASVRFR